MHPVHAKVAAANLPVPVETARDRTAEPAEVVPMATLGEAAEAAEPALSWTQETGALCPRDSRHGRLQHQAHLSGRDPSPKVRASKQKGEVRRSKIRTRYPTRRQHRSCGRSLAQPEPMTAVTADLKNEPGSGPSIELRSGSPLRHADEPPAPGERDDGDVLHALVPKWSSVPGHVEFCGAAEGDVGEVVGPLVLHQAQ